MVSLETETDRTLFFDLLPIDVGSIAGFNTRIQLYTVPGQVFYNTTRKLVLKGVDGVVFVADSQRAMLQANIDSFRTWRRTWPRWGCRSETLPLVLQYNKRDLADICSVEEMNAALNRHDWPYFEASAVTGQGVFETLKGISRFTLLSLKKRLARGGDGAAPRADGAPRPAPRCRRLAPAATRRRRERPRAAPAPPARRAAAPAPPRRGAARPRPRRRLHRPRRTRIRGPPPRPPRHRRPGAAAPARTPPLRGRSSVDVLGELEKLRREARRPCGSATAPRADR